MTEHASIGVAVTQWNHANLTISLLNQLLEHPGLDYIALCDNGSDHWEFKKLYGFLDDFFRVDGKERSPTVICIRNTVNSGFAIGMNLAISQLIEKQVDWVWLLNNDISISSDSLNQITEKLQVLTPGIYGTSMKESNSAVFTGSYAFDKYTTRFAQIDSPHELEKIATRNRYISGANMIIHKNVIETIGGLNKTGFLYFEELDFIRRAEAANFDQHYIEGPIVEHLGAGSSSSEEFSKKRIYHETWSTLNYYLRHERRLFPLIYFGRTVARIITLALSGRWKLCGSTLLAVAHFSRRTNKDRKRSKVESVSVFEHT